MAVFEMRNARKAFGALEVLKGVSLKVEKGEVVSIIGPSGGGKSTMLRCATLLETMDSGTLAYGENVAAREENGKSVYAGKAALAQVRRQFGLVFQQFDLFPHYTVLKNVCDAPISVQKRDRAEVEAEAMALLDKMGLKGKENAYPYQLSGGQQQRGITSEQQSNFLAVLACTRCGDANYNYAGWMLGYIHLGNALYRVDPDAWQQIRDSLPDEIVLDLRYNSAYWAQYKGLTATVTQSLNDKMIKSYGDELGTQSYGAVVDLLVNYYA